MWLGMTPKLGKSRPHWWRWIVITGILVTTVFSLFPPIGGTFTDVVITDRMDSSKYVPWFAVVTGSDADASDVVTMTDYRDSRVVVAVQTTPETASLLHSGQYKGRTLIVPVRRRGDDMHAVSQPNAALIVDPMVTLPYIVGLEERARLIFFHVPMSWVATIAYLISMVYAIMYLRMRKLDSDTKSMAAASIGTLYAVLATITGSLWARFNWGSFWNWDPRETSIFLLLLVYAAYFLLRNSIDDPVRKARLSASYSVVAFITVPFLIFILPRLLPGLHPGSSDDVNAGPLLSPKSDALNTTNLVVYGLSLFSFTLVYYWLMNIRIRLETLRNKLKVMSIHD